MKEEIGRLRWKCLKITMRAREREREREGGVRGRGQWENSKWDRNTVKGRERGE